ncbi:probable carboxylesterase 12 [Triticum aestivum]|uniref:probable carboxylesterase 12 n=1 Tax=Triticum aestivum TaxID=4565 RepID=UPI001D015BD1|nr:probable carboxylesterase 12 [Triticum aestivum]
MHPSKTSPANEKDGRNISVDMYPFIRKYKDGSIERFLRSPFVLASPDQAGNRGVATRDVVIDKAPGVSVRLFLPSRAAETADRNRLPLVIYVHGGSFCTESAFGRTYHRYATSLAASAGALVVSVEYRLAPEFPIPAAYDDAWAALQWAASSSDPWVASYADSGRTFLAGDSAGGNIVYHTAVRASHELNDDMMDIAGLIMVHPYFWGDKRLPSELAWDVGDGVAAVFPPYGVDRLWPFVTAGQAGNDDPRIDPPASEISSLACRRVLMAVAGKDTLRERGLDLAASMRDHDAPWPWMMLHLSTPSQRHIRPLLATDAVTAPVTTVHHLVVVDAVAAPITTSSCHTQQPPHDVDDAFAAPITMLFAPPSPSSGIAPQPDISGIAPSPASSSRRHPPPHMETTAPPSLSRTNLALIPIMQGRREVTVVESEGEDHGFHLYSPLRATSKRLMGSIVQFINQQPNSSPANRMVLGVPTTPFKDVFGYGLAMKSWGTCSSMPRNGATSMKIGRVGQSNKISVRLPMPAAVPWTRMINNFF